MSLSVAKKEQGTREDRATGRTMVHAWSGKNCPRSALLRVLLVLMLLATGWPASGVIAQDASTPVAEPAELPAEVVETPTPALEPTAVPETPTTAPAEPTTPVEPTEAPAPNTDRIAPLPEIQTIQPGQRLALSFIYQITTGRLETSIHFELRTAENLRGESWLIEANGLSGYGALDLTDSATTPGELALTIYLTAPGDATDAEALVLIASSTVRTPAEQTEPGVAIETPVASLLVDRPEPSPTTESPATPLPEPSPTTESPATPLPEPPASPVAETPAASATPAPAAPIDLAAELTLTGRKAVDTIAIGETRTVTLNYVYKVGFARAGTTISAQLVNWDNSPLDGWSATINDAGDSYSDIEHLEPGSTFDLAIAISVDETVAANAKARLLFTISVDPAAAVDDDSAEFTFAVESVESSDPELSETFDGPMLRVDGRFTPSLVTGSPNNGLSCTDPAGSVPSDSIIPGEAIRFDCQITVVSLALSINMTGTATIQVEDPAGWFVASSGEVLVLGLPVAAPVGEFQPSSSGFSASRTVSLGTTPIKFSVWVRAPMVSTSDLSGSTSNLANANVTVQIHTQCTASTLLGQRNCQGGTGSRDSTVSVSAFFRNTGETSSGGGQATNLGLLGSIGSQLTDNLLFSLYCDQPSGGFVIVPNSDLVVNCHIKSLVALASLVGLSLNADLTVGFTDPSDQWSISVEGYSAGPDGVINLPLGTLLNLNAVSSTPINITLRYNARICITSNLPTQPLNALQLIADYSLSTPLTPDIPVSDGWASVPIQLSGQSPASAIKPPAVSVGPVDFGSFTYNGAMGWYDASGANDPMLDVTLTAPTAATDCLSQNWYVTAQFSPLSRTSSPGPSLPVTSISFAGTPTTDLLIPGTEFPQLPPNGTSLVLIESSDPLTSPRTAVFGMSLAPPNTQPTGNYEGTVTLTAYSDSP